MHTPSATATDRDRARDRTTASDHIRLGYQIFANGFSRFIANNFVASTNYFVGNC